MEYLRNAGFGVLILTHLVLCAFSLFGVLVIRYDEIFKLNQYFIYNLLTPIFGLFSFFASIYLVYSLIKTKILTQSQLYINKIILLLPFVFFGIGASIFCYWSAFQFTDDNLRYMATPVAENISQGLGIALSSLISLFVTIPIWLTHSKRLKHPLTHDV